jgi:hypothetical protein
MSQLVGECPGRSGECSNPLGETFPFLGRHSPFRVRHSPSVGDAGSQWPQKRLSVTAVSTPFADVIVRP